MIGRIFLWLFWACNHKWKIIRSNNYKDFGFNEDDILSTGVKYHTQCEKCGKMRFYKSNV